MTDVGWSLGCQGPTQPIGVRWRGLVGGTVLRIPHTYGQSSLVHSEMKRKESQLVGRLLHLWREVLLMDFLMVPLG
jgi:hypothetical protein